MSQAAEMTAAVSKAQSRLRQRQVEFARLSRECKARLQHVAAQQLLQEVPVNIEKLEQDVQAAHKAAAPFLASDKADILEEFRAQSVVAGLRAHMQKLGVDADALFGKVTSGDSATEEELIAFLGGLPSSESSGAFLFSLSAEQAAGALMHAAGEGSGVAAVSAAAFRTLLRDRYVCSSRVPLSDAFEGGIEVGTLEVGEVVEIVEQQDTGDGVVRAKCTLARSGELAWATLPSPTSNSDPKPLVSATARLESVLAYIDALCARCAEAAAQVERKAVECAAYAQRQQNAAFADVRSRLLQLKMQVNVHKLKMEQLRKRMVGAKQVLLQHWGISQQKSQDSRCRSLVDKLLGDATVAVDTAEDKTGKLLEAIRSQPAFRQTQDGALMVQTVKRAVDEASKACAEAKAAIERFTESKDAAKGQHRNHILKIRVELMKLSSRAATMEKKCRTAAEPLW
uniref:Uncharacterized protein n=1 Tax=Pyrodinium bahamense TaxID=73915 RepID=A0A6T9C7J9_9DINO|mmetsp:Transcript_55132/g.152779  ORF Transcript_55132/g.152779 Transcript_55132/m.152779 type:complete len:455 (+) Transcript_55132:66-1430(+)